MSEFVPDKRPAYINEWGEGWHPVIKYWRYTHVSKPRSKSMWFCPAHENMGREPKSHRNQRYKKRSGGNVSWWNTTTHSLNEAAQRKARCLCCGVEADRLLAKKERSEAQQSFPSGPEGK